MINKYQPDEKVFKDFIKFFELFPNGDYEDFKEYQKLVRKKK